MNKREVKQWDDNLLEQRKELGISTFRNPTADGKGSFRIEEDTGKCKLCGKETHYILFLDKYNQGTGVCVCKQCLQECVNKMED
jgi:hypothetical protein